jgi:hypothetical protein
VGLIGEVKHLVSFGGGATTRLNLAIAYCAAHKR